MPKVYNIDKYIEKEDNTIIFLPAPPFKEPVRLINFDTDENGQLRYNPPGGFPQINKDVTITTSGPNICPKCNGKGWYFVNEWFGPEQGRKDCQCTRKPKDTDIG